MAVSGAAGRFTGLAARYDAARPMLPAAACRIVAQALGRPPRRVVDLGCGTGLSALPWLAAGARVTGVDLNAGMLRLARARGGARFTPRRAAAQQTGLPGGAFDVAICAQAFHWMDPEPTLREIHRLLRPGGVFAAIDYDWPPGCDARVEAAYRRLRRLAEAVEAASPQGPAPRRPKSGHLAAIEASGLFRGARELAFTAVEPGGAARLYRMACSQSGIRRALRLEPETMRPALQAYRALLDACLGGRALPLRFQYRMRLAEK